MRKDRRRDTTKLNVVVLRNFTKATKKLWQMIRWCHIRTGWTQFDSAYSEINTVQVHVLIYAIEIVREIHPLAWYIKLNRKGSIFLRERMVLECRNLMQSTVSFTEP
jgi:molybdenum cofactor biosynthesis enzyme MoaA